MLLCKGDSDLVMIEWLTRNAESCPDDEEEGLPSMVVDTYGQFFRDSMTAGQGQGGSTYEFELDFDFFVTLFSSHA